jgi:hypothetical protein
VMARVREPADGAGFCAPSEVTITRLIIATAVRDFMRILIVALSEPPIVLLRSLVVKQADCFARAGVGIVSAL